MTSAALLLWRGELRVQGLSRPNRVLLVAELAAAALILASLIARVRSAVTEGTVSPTNLAVLDCAVAMIIVANILLLGERTGTGVPAIAAWVRPLPLSGRRVRSLLLLLAALKSSLFSAMILGSVAVGALLGNPGMGARLETACAVVVLPLLPVAVALRWNAARPTPTSPALVVAPLSLALAGLTAALPPAPGPVATIVRVLATPGNVLLGLSRPSVAAAVLLAWLAATWALLASLEVGRAAHSDVARPSRARLLATARRPGNRGLAADLVAHRVPRGDALAALALGAVVAAAAAVAIVGAPSEPVVPAVVLAALALPATLAGYAHRRNATRLPASASAWLRTTPLPWGRWHRARHVACTTAALVGTVPLALLAPWAASVADQSPWTLLEAALAGPLVLSGWLGVGFAVHRARRWLTAVLVSYLATSRAVAVALVVTLPVATAAPVRALLLLVAADLLTAVAGHGALLRISSRRTA
ncbi:MAG TPA: hypothetical protein VKB14_12275 [Actinomycetales bacterium]|nr:hypothetical protein [Actinomycetales bacterium]